METKYLILGSTGSIGFAFTNELLSHGIKTTLLVRNKKKAKTLFMNNPILEIIEGDVNDLSTLKNVTKVKVISKTILNILSWFVPVVKELKENFYQFENAVILDDTKIKKHFPNFQSTKMEDAIAETIDWFKNNSR